MTKEQDLKEVADINHSLSIGLGIVAILVVVIIVAVSFSHKIPNPKLPSLPDSLPKQGSIAPRHSAGAFPFHES